MWGTSRGRVVGAEVTWGEAQTHALKVGLKEKLKDGGVLTDPQEGPCVLVRGLGVLRIVSSTPPSEQGRRLLLAHLYPNLVPTPAQPIVQSKGTLLT